MQKIAYDCETNVSSWKLFNRRLEIQRMLLSDSFLNRVPKNLVK